MFNNKLIFGFWVMTALMLNSAQAQSMNDFYKQEIHRISKKIYMMGLSGSIPAYMSDSLATAYSLETVKKRGSEEIVIQTRNGLDDNLMDSVYTKPLNPENIAPDLGISFHLSSDNAGSVIYSPAAIAPLYFKTFVNIQFTAPLFYLRWSDVINNLTPDERNLLFHYNTWKQFGTNVIYTRNDTESLKENWSNFIESARKSYNSQTPSLILGKSIEELTTFYLFQFYFNQYKIGIYDADNNTISQADFTKKFQHKIETQLPLWATPDRDHIKDTFYWVLPQNFDSLQVISIKNELKWNVWIQEEINSNLKYTRLVQYSISDADVKKYLHPDLYFFCKYYAENKKN